MNSKGQVDRKPIKILGISGSLRAQSANSRLLSAFERLLPPHAKYETYDKLANLPHFNPDLEDSGLPVHEEVKQWRAHLAWADAIVICTPEYARGVPGSLKNALDWVVSSGEFVDKPTAAIGASPHPQGGSAALDSLIGTLGMMSAVIPEGAGLCIPFITKKFAADGTLNDAETEDRLRKLAAALAEAAG
ncbi:NADPH-dependent FMN reductase [Saccharibacillus deserti]|uniref:NADPH-dependent FMN reductase n=1 Tax=Saccharibacillus deserti TaxID=1634444 RepID=UPI0031B63D7D